HSSLPRRIDNSVGRDFQRRVRDYRQTGRDRVSEQWQQVQTVAETWSPEQVLRWAHSTFQQDIAMASGFGAEGMVLIDMASRLNPDFRVFTLDTEFLFPETYELIDRVEKRYGIKVERVYSNLTPEDPDGIYGQALGRRHQDALSRPRQDARRSTTRSGLT